ncbi:hypothetical protein AKJ16_DCAP09866 [Drosera capensis]
MKHTKEEKLNQRLVRAIKTLFFLFTLLVSFLVVSAAPVFLAIADATVPSALVSASLRSSFFFSLRSHVADYDFGRSLVDLPFVSIVRSIIILSVYRWCDGPGKSRGPYLAVAVLCSVVSLVFVSVKASFVFGSNTRNLNWSGSGRGTMDVAIFVCSYVMAVGHAVVAYRISCRERKKLLIYKIDIEAVAACKNGFPRYQKAPLEERKE